MDARTKSIDGYLWKDILITLEYISIAVLNCLHDKSNLTFSTKPSSVSKEKKK